MRSKKQIHRLQLRARTQGPRSYFESGGGEADKRLKMRRGGGAENTFSQ